MQERNVTLFNYFYISFWRKSNPLFWTFFFFCISFHEVFCNHSCHFAAQLLVLQVLLHNSVTYYSILIHALLGYHFFFFLGCGANRKGTSERDAKLQSSGQKVQPSGLPLVWERPPPGLHPLDEILKSVKIKKKKERKKFRLGSG